MFPLTKQERGVLLFLLSVILAGNLARVLAKGFPAGHDDFMLIEKKIASPVIDLNAADQTDLERLPCVGAVTAQAILRYRDAHGGFRSVDELKDIRGIGPVKFERLSPFVRVGEGGP